MSLPRFTLLCIAAFLFSRPVPGAEVSPVVPETYGKLPLSFERNVGQSDETVDFLVRGDGFSGFLTPSEATFVVTNGRGGSRKPRIGALKRPKQAPAVLRLQILEANRDSKPEALDELEGKANYLIGNDPSKWRTGIQTYRRVRYREVYPGIDLVYYGNQRQLEYDFVVAPGADPGAISLRFENAEKVEVNAGDLIIHTAVGSIRQTKPLVYQEIAEKRQIIAGNYVLNSDGRIAFALGEYDVRHPLVIDPVLIYSSYLGGKSSDEANAVAVDFAGNAYFAGTTSSEDFPIVGKPITPPASQHAFITKLNASGTAIIYSTCLGGNHVDFGSGIAVDPSGSAYVAGMTFSEDFPTVNAVQPIHAGGEAEEAFVAKLNPAGDGLVYSTYLGGTGSDGAADIALDASGAAYVSGMTASANFPILNAVQGTLMGTRRPADGFVTKLAPEGNALIYSTYLGGTEDEWAYGIAVDTSNCAYVTGITASMDFPTVAAVQAMKGGDYESFVTKLSAGGNAIIYSTFLGGSQEERGWGVAVDSAGNAYVTGTTFSSDFPTTANAHQSASGGQSDVYVTKLNPAGSALVYSTYLGGNSAEIGGDIAVDSSNSAYVTGTTLSPNFPTLDALQAAPGGGYDCFVTKLQPAGNGLVYSSYLGGSGNEFSQGIAVDAEGSAYVVGLTGSANFPTVNPVQNQPGGSSDVFVSKIGDPAPPSGQLLNISTRLRVQTGENVLIAGFIITGTDPKQVIIRGIGPSLTGVGRTLPNPTLELRQGSTTLATNDNWKENQAAVEATTIPPTNDLESAIVATLSPGSYTAILADKNGASGVGIVELYDLTRASDSKLANISSRGFVDTGDNVMIGGFILGEGAGAGTSRVLVRALGPSLSGAGIQSALPDTILEIRGANGALIARNDNWKDSQQADIEATTIPPSSNLESAIVAMLAPGNYTAIVRGKGSETGVGLVEVYNLR